jgi:uncharacterized protein (TIGR00369 family)
MTTSNVDGAGSRGPVIAAVAAGELDGLALMRAWASGEVPAPPIADTIGFTVESVAPGEVTFSITPAKHHYNLLNAVQGGVYAVVLDSATACAVHTMLPAGTTFASLDLNVKFLRGLTVDSGPISCVGRVVHLGRRTALAQAELVGPEGRLYAQASSTCLILRPENGKPDAAGDSGPA